MSPYTVSDLIGVRLFTTSSAAALEGEINQWLKGNPDKKSWTLFINICGSLKMTKPTRV